MNTSVVLALARMAFGKNVTKKTEIIHAPAPYMKIIDKTTGNSRSITIIELQKFVYKSWKRELTIRLAYLDKFNRLFVRLSEIKYD